MAGKFGPKNRHCSTGLYLVPYEPCRKITKSRITFSLNLRTCLASLWGFMFSGSKHTGLRHFKTCNLAPNTGFCYQTEEDGGWHGGDRERTRDMAVVSRSPTHRCKRETCCQSAPSPLWGPCWCHEAGPAGPQMLWHRQEKQGDWN